MRRREAQKRWLDYITEDMKEYNMTEEMAENRSVWHMQIKAGQLLQGGGLYVRAKGVTRSLRTSDT